MIDIISAGPGREGLLTLEARETLDRSEVVFCASRHRKLVPSNIRTMPLVPLARALEDIASCQMQGLRTSVMVSGDAGMYSLLGPLRTRFGEEQLRVIPGISSVSAFAAGRGRLWHNAVILSAHGREMTPSRLCFEAAVHAEVILLMDAEHNPAWVRKTLDEGGLERVRLTIGERLSYEDERITEYQPGLNFDPLSVAWLENPEVQCGLPPVGLPDEDFRRGGIPMTKREIRVQILSMLKLRPDSVVWDIGAGTGSVSVECARQCPYGTVAAIEREEEGVQLIRENAKVFHLQNLTVVSGEAPDALSDLPLPTHVFLGGTGGHAGEILKKLAGIGRPIRLCATAVTMESGGFLLEQMQKLPDFEAVQIGVSRLEKIGGYTMFRAQNPVFVMAGTLGMEEQG